MLNLFRRKLPRSAIMWFAGAALAAVGAVLVVQAHVATLSATRPDVGQPTAVVVAASDLMRGTTLDATSLGVIDLPSALLPPGAISTPEQVAGRVLGADLAEGEVLTETRLAGVGAGPVAALVPPGLRAFVLPTGPPAGTIRPGDEIDVLATYGANAGRPYTETVAAALEGDRRRRPGRDRRERRARRPSHRGARRPAHRRAAGARVESRAPVRGDPR